MHPGNRRKQIRKVTMKKSILYRLFRIGAFPRRMRPALEQEDIVLLDEGIPGMLITRHVDGPGRRWRHRAEGFSGWLVITGQRLMCQSFGRRQINMAVEDPRIKELCVDIPQEKRLSISFESSVFREGWKGVMEYRFNTEKAQLFYDKLVLLGAQAGRASDAERPG